MSYRNTVFIGFALICSSLLLQCHQIQGKEFLVGDEKGWSGYPGISNWPNGKNFTPGDVLVFKYDKKKTNIWLIGSGYRSYAKDCYDTCENYLCDFTQYDSGNDRVVVKEGLNYFRSGDYTACVKGLKFKVCAEVEGKRTNCAY